MVYFVFAHLPTRIIANIILYLAIISLLLHFAAFYIEKNPHEIEKLIEERLLIDVKFSSVKVHYNLLSPSIKLYNLTIFQSAVKNQIHINKDLHFNSASISINLLKSLLFLKPDIRFINLDGFKTSIIRSQNNTFSIGSLDLSSSSDKNSPRLPLWLLQLKSFSLTNTQLIINDEITGIKDYKLDNIHIKFTNKNQWIHNLSISATNLQTHSNSFPVSFDQLIFSSQLRGSSYNLKEWTGKSYLYIKNLHFNNTGVLSEFMTNNSGIKLLKGIFSGKLWATISQSSVSEVIGQIQLKEVELQKNKSKQILQIKQLTTLLRLNENKHFLQSSQQPKLDIKNWLVSLYQLNINTPIHENTKSSIILPYSNLNVLKKSNHIEVASHINKLPLKGLDDLVDFFGNEFSQAYQQLQPTGLLNHLRAKLIIESEQIKDYKITTKLNHISAQAWQEIPQFENLSATLWINKQYGFININSSDLIIDLKPLFRHKWQFDQLSSQVSWQTIGSQFWVNANNNKIQNDHLNIKGNFQLWIDKNNKKSSPLMLINAYFDRVDASYVPLYIPTDAFSHALTDWLDHAFVAAHVTDGGILYRGRLQQFPYSNHQGLLEITFHAQDMLLNYYNGWPKFENVKSQIQFTETGLFIDVKNVQLYDSFSHNTKVVLDNYLSSDIKIHSIIKSNASDAFKYLQQTNILSQNYIDKLTSNGKINIDLSLSIPADDKPTKSIAKVDFNSLEFAPKWLKPLAINNIKGDIVINNGNISSQSLNGQLNQEPIKVTLNTLNKSNQDISQVSINGLISTETIKLSGYVPESLKYLFTYLEGITPYKAKLLLSYHNGQLIPDLIIQSNLKGIKSLLPEPFNKDKNEEKQVTIEFKENSKSTQLNFNYLNVLSYCNQMNINQLSQIKTHINFFGNSCLLPINNITSITGKLDLKNYSQWQSIISNEDQTNHSIINKPAIEFELQELILPADVLESSTSQESSTNQESSTEKKSKTNNSQPFLSLNGNIKNLFIGKSNLGKLTIDSHNKSEQLVYDKINLVGEQINLSINGYTETKITKPITHLNGTLNIKNTGSLLKKLDYYNGLDLADGNFEGYLKWHGSLTSFSAKNLFGKIKFSLNNGNLTEVNPGIGKIIELINLNDIKQRLNLGFNTLSKSGLEFDSIVGNLLFNENNLYTRDIKLDSNIAKININGYLNMDKKTCQHLLAVTPNISSGLPYAGLAIGGPAGAALGYLGQKVLGKEFNKISQYKYNISGLCKDPIITNKTILNQSSLN